MRCPGKWLIAGWIAVALIGLASLSLSHMASMPKPDDEARLTRAMLALRQDATPIFLVHVIYANCSCTQRLFAHLVERGAFAGVEELILFVGEDTLRRASAERAGFRFMTISAADLASRFGLEAAPILMVFDASGRLDYVGGYFKHPAAIVALDESIYVQLQQGASPASLPVFGCAVSARLQKSVDPLGIVY